MWSFGNRHGREQLGKQHSGARLTLAMRCQGGLTGPLHSPAWATATGGKER